MGKFIGFNKNDYLADLRRMNQQVMSEVLAKMSTDYRTNLAGNAFNSLDVKYIATMMASVNYRMNGGQGGKIEGYLGVGNRLVNNEYYRVVYYEYGTGEYMMPPPNYNAGADPYRNPARGGEHAFYTWEDDHQTLGGKTRKGNRKKPTRISPVKDNGKPNPYGQPIAPGFNLSRAVISAKPFLKDSLQKKVRQMNPITYTSLRGMKIGR